MGKLSNRTIFEADVRVSRKIFLPTQGLQTKGQHGETTATRVSY